MSKADGKVIIRLSQVQPMITQRLNAKWLWTKKIATPPVATGEGRIAGTFRRQHYLVTGTCWQSIEVASDSKIFLLPGGTGSFPT